MGNAWLKNHSLIVVTKFATARKLAKAARAIAANANTPAIRTAEMAPAMRMKTVTVVHLIAEFAHTAATTPVMKKRIAKPALLTVVLAQPMRNVVTKSVVKVKTVRIARRIAVPAPIAEMNPAITRKLAVLAPWIAGLVRQFVVTKFAMAKKPVQLAPLTVALVSRRLPMKKLRLLLHPKLPNRLTTT